MICFSKKSLQIHDSTLTENKKDSNKCIHCIQCKTTNKIVTLTCNHCYCVKCFTKNRYCIQCEKLNYKRNWFWSWCCG